MTLRGIEPARQPQYPVYVPDTTTPAVLISDLFEGDGPHREYADQWVRVGGLQANVLLHATVIDDAA